MIELLIVVAIIAILAAIAVPNLLEAQVRSKCARIKGDFHALATAMEAYAVDWGTYVPYDSDETWHANPGECGLLLLTTPIAYLTTLACDPLNTSGKSPGDTAGWYELGSGVNNRPSQQAWLLLSYGPDRDDDTWGNDDYPFKHTGPIPVFCRGKQYDPTNGTISNGDLYRTGGNSPPLEFLGYSFSRH